MAPTSAAQADSMLHQPELIQQHDQIARTYHPLDDHHAIDPGFVVVEAIDSAEQLGLRLSRIRVQRDHLATGVLISDHYYRLVPNPQFAADVADFRVSSSPL